MVKLVDTHDLPAGRQAQNRVIIFMYYTYAIKSKTNKYIYVGISDNPKRRVEHHNRGYNKTTKPYTPFEIILLEKFMDRETARKREKYLKSGIGKEYLKSL